MTDTRNTFTLERLDRESGALVPVTFERGEYVRTEVGEGEIAGISHARREFKVGGIWFAFGYAYKAVRPAKVSRGNTTLGAVIERINARASELTDADRVPAFYGKQAAA